MAGMDTCSAEAAGYRESCGGAAARGGMCCMVQSLARDGDDANRGAEAGSDMAGGVGAGNGAGVCGRVARSGGVETKGSAAGAGGCQAAAAGTDAGVGGA